MARQHTHIHLITKQKWNFFVGKMFGICIYILYKKVRSRLEDYVRERIYIDCNTHTHNTCYKVLKISLVYVFEICLVVTVTNSCRMMNSENMKLLCLDDRIFL